MSGISVFSQKQAISKKNAIFDIKIDRYIRAFLVYLKKHQETVSFYRTGIRQSIGAWSFMVSGRGGVWMVTELGKMLRILLSGSEKMICMGISGWAIFGCTSVLSLLFGNEFITTFSIVMFTTSSGAALIGCLLHIAELLIDKMEKRRQKA